MATQPFARLGRSLGTSIGGFFGGGGAQAEQAGRLAGLQQGALEQDIAGKRTAQELSQLKLDEANRQRQLAGPEATLERAMLANGIPQAEVGIAKEFLENGRIGRYDTGGYAGPVMPTPAYASPENMRGLQTSIAQDLAVQAGSAKGAEDYFKGRNQQFET